MKFRQLGPTSRLIAVAEYLKGWSETHPNDPLGWHEAEAACLDDDDIDYSVEGHLIDDGLKTFQVRETHTTTYTWTVRAKTWMDARNTDWDDSAEVDISYGGRTVEEV